MQSKVRIATALGLLAVGLWSLRGPRPALAEDQPTIAKDSVQVNAFTLNVFKKNFDVWSWVPTIQFRVNGPIPSGAQLYAEFAIPGAAPIKFDCPTEATTAGRWWKTSGGGRDIPEEKGTQFTGMVPFSIKMRSELAGTDVTLFSGKALFQKEHSNEAGPKAVNKWVYFVNDDWNLPIGYVYLTPDELKGWDRPGFNVAFWVRGEGTRIEPHLFYMGKEVGKKMFDGMEVGKPGGEADIEKNPTHYVADNIPQKAKWARVKCDWPNVKGWDKTGETNSLFGPPHTLAGNPGEYEVKILWNNHLARSIKFTVAADGKFDNGIATNNKLGSDRVIVPVSILGDQDGTWDKNAWKTQAFYGNPLTGFTAAP